MHVDRRIIADTDDAARENPSGAPQSSTSISTLVDAITRRSIKRSILELGPPPCPLTWFALGSHGRQEPAPGSDIDSALAWDGDEDDQEARSYMLSLGSRVSEALSHSGFAADQRGVTAGQDLFNRPVGGWRRLIRESIADPTARKGLIVISLLLDGRALYQEGGEPDLLREFETANRRPGLLRLMLRLALAQGPAVGRLRGFALERSGEHRGRLDIKHRGLLSVTTIARYASLAAGAIAARSTPARLAAAAAAGTIDDEDARSLGEAFEFFHALRLEHQAEQLEHGIKPDDFLDPKALEPGERRRLRDALREVRAVQRRIGARLSRETTFGSASSGSPFDGPPRSVDSAGLRPIPSALPAA